jgi:hypothetical protein
MIWLAVASLLCALLADPEPIRAQASSTRDAPSVIGTWIGAASTPESRVDLTFQLQQHGERVQGTYDSRSAVLIALNVRITGTLRGDTLTLFEQGTATPVVEARVKDATLTGVFRGTSGTPARLDARRLE